MYEKVTVSALPLSVQRNRPRDSHRTVSERFVAEVLELEKDGRGPVMAVKAGHRVSGPIVLRAVADEESAAGIISSDESLPIAAIQMDVVP